MKLEMRRPLGLVTLFMLASLPAFAQDIPMGEVGVGYTFRSYGLPAFQRPPSQLGLNGVNVTLDYNFKPWLGAALDVDSTENTSNGANTTLGTALIGPQIYPFGHKKLTFFVHALIGGGRFYFHSPCACFGAGGENGGSDYFVQYDFAWAVGGGVDYTIRPNVGIRLGQFDFEQVGFGLQDFGKGAAPAQNNWKYSAAILLRF
jgi:opacity protein-like surface antigen